MCNSNCSLPSFQRDLKLENFLFSDTGAESELKMIDFGLSKVRQFVEILDVQRSNFCNEGTFHI